MYTAMNESQVVELNAPAGDALGGLSKRGARQQELLVQQTVSIFSKEPLIES